MTKHNPNPKDKRGAMPSLAPHSMPDWARAVGDPLAHIDPLYQQALLEIEARGEKPEDLLASFAHMMAGIAADVAIRALKSAPPTRAQRDAKRAADTLAQALYFEESVAAGHPTPGSATDGRPAAMSDVFGPIGLSGKLLARVSGWSMIDSSIKDGDIVLVDPKATVRDGDIVLASVAGLGQVVKRLRLAERDTAILESANPEFKPIVISDPDSLRIHGKVLWRAGPL